MVVVVVGQVMVVGIHCVCVHFTNTPRVGQDVSRLPCVCVWAQATHTSMDG